MDNLEKIESNIRLAQFGGAGGGHQQPFAPGSSPFGKGSGQSGGSGINRQVVDEGLDATMSRTHNPPDPDSTRNFEKRLEALHAYQEDDSIPYDLSPSEREKNRIRKEIRRREKYYNQAEESLIENSVPFILKYFPPKPEHFTTTENLLESRRKSKPEDERNPREDNWVKPDAPTRIHTSMRKANNDVMPHGTNRMQGDNNEDKDDDFKQQQSFGVFDPRQWKFHNVPMGNTTFLQTGKDVENHLNKPATDDFGGGTSWGTPALAFDYPAADEVHYDGADVPKSTPPSPIPPAQSSHTTRSTDDPFLGLEGKLDLLSKEPPHPLPSDPYRARKEDEIKNQGKEPQGVADKYPEKNYFDVGNARTSKINHAIDDFFRLSQVQKDDNIKPYRLYHGTNHPDVHTIEDLVPSEPGARGVFGKGTYFALNPELAQIYGQDYGYNKGKVLEADGYFRNPLVIDATESINYRIAPEFQEQYDNSGYDNILPGERIPPFDAKINGEWHEFRSFYDLRNLASWAAKHGHDAMILRGIQDDAHGFNEEVVVLDTTTLRPIKQERTAQNSNYTYHDADLENEWDDEQGEDTRYDDHDAAQQLAKDADIHIYSNRNLYNTVKDSEGNTVGALWTSLEGNTFTFDVIVAPQAQRQGIATKLVQDAINEYKYIQDADSDIKIYAQVVRAEMKQLLENKFGWQVVSGHDGNWMMEPK